MLWLPTFVYCGTVSLGHGNGCAKGNGDNLCGRVLNGFGFCMMQRDSNSLLSESVGGAAESVVGRDGLGGGDLRVLLAAL